MLAKNGRCPLRGSGLIHMPNAVEVSANHFLTYFHSLTQPVFVGYTQIGKPTAHSKG